jgi:hypothetical protein
MISLAENGQKINIKELSIDTPKKSQPCQEYLANISQDDWEKVSKKLSVNYIAKGWYQFFEKAAAMSILDPEKTPKPLLNEGDYEAVVNDLQVRKNDNMFNFGVLELALASEIQVLFPEKNVAVDTDLKPESVILEIGRKFSDPLMAADGLISYFILFPDRKDLLDKDLFGNFLQENTETLGKMESLTCLTALKLLFPDLYKEPPPHVLEDLRTTVESRKSGDDFFTFASYLKMLVAEEVKMTPKGLEIKMDPDKDFKDASLSVPERRRF